MHCLACLVPRHRRPGHGPARPPARRRPQRLLLMGLVSLLALAAAPARAGTAATPASTSAPAAATSAEPATAPAALQQLLSEGDALAAGYRGAAGATHPTPHPTADATAPIPAPLAEATASGYSRLYFDIFEGEGLELSLGGRDRRLLGAIEQGFARCIRAALERQPAAELQTAWRGLRDDLLRARAPLASARAQQDRSAFWPALLIVLREGAEALLVVTALAAFLRRSGQPHRLPWLWGGVGAAVAASAALAWGLAGVLAAAGPWRGTALGLLVCLAALMLGHMAAWLAARRSAERWNQTLRAHMAGALDGTPWLTAGVAFIAVFREGAETLLFFQALAGSAPGQGLPLAAGAGVAVLGLMLLSIGLQRLGLRLPLHLFFSSTAVLLLGLALVFAGQGALLMQLAGRLPLTDWPWVPAWPWLGLHPSRETVLAQAGLLLLVLAAVWRDHRDPLTRRPSTTTAPPR
ncbi:MAG: hypothetical protein RIQ53_344 [Pseudomonadota bacterium]